MRNKSIGQEWTLLGPSWHQHGIRKTRYIFYPTGPVPSDNFHTLLPATSTSERTNPKEKIAKQLSANIAHLDMVIISIPIGS